MLGSFDYHERRDAALKAVLDLFTATTGLPIGLFETPDDGVEPIISTDSLENFEEHCKLIRSFPGGNDACDRDQCLRAQKTFERAKGALSCCHAGLWNQTVPILVEGKVRAVLSFGETLLEDGEYMQKTLARHQSAVDRLNLSPEQAGQLKDALQTVKKHTPQDISKFTDMLAPIQSFIFGTIDREEEIAHNLEKVVHELQTRLQAVIANSENFMLEAPYLKPKEIQSMANDLLSSAMALVVIVNNLGDFQHAIKFEEKLLRPLFVEAWRIYAGEAKRRNISLRLNMNRINGQEPKAEISHQHLELAVNNLIHNAIKYSFDGSPNRERFVEVDGNVEGPYYKICVSNYGIGITPEEIEEGKIFQDGYQGKLTEGEYRTGSGKGLTFVKRVIERHHGEIKVESFPKGSPEEVGQPYLNRFTIYLPLHQAKRKVSQTPR
ncbi:MAG: PocR ligand-binding domain-containing protein [Chloroflexota bacterium]